ncbi:MAG: CBS domain-containing protein [Nitrososphaerota archaeon]|nr:CBS domain-containing protein [Nitrososphaerota archaeon]
MLSEGRLLDRDFHTVSPDDTVALCVARMERFGVKVLVVVDEKGAYAGAVTEKAVAASRLDPLKAKARALCWKPPAAAADSGIREVARMMVESDIGTIPVLDDGAVLGVVTDAALLAAAMEPPFSRTKLREVMRRSPVTVGETESVGKALGLMRRHGVRRLPVMDGPRVVGVVTMRDVITKFPAEKSRMARGQYEGESAGLLDEPVSSIMSSPVASLRQESSVKEAFDLMSKRDISSVVVMNELGELEGLLTRHDLLRPLAGAEPAEGGVRVQITVKLPRGEADRKGIRAIVRSAANRRPRAFDGSTLSVYLKPHREHKKGLTLTHCRLVLQGAAGRYSAAEEGWGELQAVRTAVESLERQLSKKMRGKGQPGHKTFYEATGSLY